MWMRAERDAKGSNSIIDPVVVGGIRINAQASELRRFIQQLFSACSLVFIWAVLCFVTFNIVDPYGVTGVPTIEGFNDIKPQQREAGRIYKPISFLRQIYLDKDLYNGIVLGGSRELRGIDPLNPSLRAAGYRLYNFGLVEGRPYESASVAELVASHLPIDSIIFDVDYQTI